MGGAGLGWSQGRRRKDWRTATFSPPGPLHAESRGMAPGRAYCILRAHGNTKNLWQVALSPKSWQITSAPERLTFGTGLEDLPSGAGPRLVFASLTGNIDIWSVRFIRTHGANQGRVSGSIQRLTQDASPDTHPALSSDGTKLVFRSNRSEVGRSGSKTWRPERDRSHDSSGSQGLARHFDEWIQGGI